MARRGLLEVGADDALAQDAPALSACYEGAVTQRVGLGPSKGRPVIKLGTPLKQYLATAAQRVVRGGIFPCDDASMCADRDENLCHPLGFCVECVSASECPSRSSCDPEYECESGDD